MQKGGKRDLRHILILTKEAASEKEIQSHFSRESFPPTACAPPGERIARGCRACPRLPVLSGAPREYRKLNDHQLKAGGFKSFRRT
jgi:hypothetical protein